MNRFKKISFVVYKKVLGCYFENLKKCNLIELVPFHFQLRSNLEKMRKPHLDLPNGANYLSLEQLKYLV